MALLAQFLLRLAFGLAVGMAITDPRHVSGGFYRNHSYVTLGLTTLAALVLFQTSEPSIAWLAVAAAVFSYFCAVSWLYEAKYLGVSLLWFVFWCSFLAAYLALGTWYETVGIGNPQEEVSIPHIKQMSTLLTMSVATSGLVLGVTTAAMLLGHWYLNSPGMKPAPLRRLLIVAALAVGLQAVVSGCGLTGYLLANPSPPLSWCLFVTLRWSFGLVGVAVLNWMAWQTLKIPNTQSATGILYVAVLGVFVGELTGLLLSAESAFPL